MKVIHLGTKILAEFGIIDDDGNLVQSVAITDDKSQPFRLSIFSSEAFFDIYNKIEKSRIELVAQAEKLDEQTKAMQEVKP